MQVELQTIKEQVTLVANRLLEVANLREGDVFVLGCSSSEICGGQIGKASSAEVGQTVIEALLPILKEKGLYLAVQGCEHINRALVIERAAAEKYGFEIVTVKPALHAGGACSVAAYERFDDPVMVEHVVARAGIDIGDTFIGQHIKHVQIPVRVGITEIGGAHVTCVRSRPKLIGGPRAQYPDEFCCLIGKALPLRESLPAFWEKPGCKPGACPCKEAAVDCLPFWGRCNIMKGRK